MPTVKKARKAGIVVITLDTPLDPTDAADANIATDNYKAGQLIGQWAEGDARRQGQRPPRSPRSTWTSTSRRSTTSATTASSTGFGIPVKDVKHFAQSDSPQIVGSDVTQGSTEGGRKAMENILQKADHIDVVYAINEPAAYGGYAALKAAGKEKGVLIVAVDGGCPASSGQGRHHRRDLAAISAADGRRRRRGDRRLRQDRQEAASASTPARSSITDHPVPGVPSITTDEALKLCWG